MPGSVPWHPLAPIPVTPRPAAAKPLTGLRLEATFAKIIAVPPEVPRAGANGILRPAGFLEHRTILETVDFNNPVGRYRKVGLGSTGAGGCFQHPRSGT